MTLGDLEHQNRGFMDFLAISGCIMYNVTKNNVKVEKVLGRKTVKGKK